MSNSLQADGEFSRPPPESITRSCGTGAGGSSRTTALACPRPCEPGFFEPFSPPRIGCRQPDGRFPIAHSINDGAQGPSRYQLLARRAGFFLEFSPRPRPPRPSQALFPKGAHHRGPPAQPPPRAIGKHSRVLDIKNPSPKCSAKSGACSGPTPHSNLPAPRALELLEDREFELLHFRFSVSCPGAQWAAISMNWVAQKNHPGGAASCFLLRAMS